MQRTPFVAISILSVLTLAAPACMTGPDDAGPDEVTTSDGDAPDLDAAKADAATELQVRAGNTTLWVRPTLALAGGVFTIRGRTSRNVTDGNGYVFDDPYGAFVQGSPRTFTVGYGLSELGPLLDGVNLFVGIGLTGGDHVTARVVVRPRFLDSSGSSKLALTAEVTPIIADGTTVFRARGRSTVAMTAVSSSAGAARLVDATHFEIDLARAEVGAIAGTATTIDVTAQIAGATVVRKAHLGLAVKKLGLTAGDAYATWPAPTCTKSVKACLAALPDGTLDFAACGDAVTTLACWGQTGAVVDGPSITASMAAADARLADAAGFAADAPALVGVDHAAAFATAVRQRVQDAVNGLSNRWYATVATRDARLAAVVDGAFDAAYARPLALVPAHPPIAGDAQRTREIVADALLAYLATQDYVHSEFGRSYDDLVKSWRGQHVQSLREFREAPDDIFVDPAHPQAPIYLGQWLGTHVEVTIDATTGAATHVLVELD